MTQVYSQLSFTCPKNESFVEFKQELKDETDTSLLEDIERVDCRSVHSRTRRVFNLHLSKTIN